MRTKACLGTALMLLAPAVAGETAIRGGLEYLQWREYHPMPVLEETGFRPFIQLDASRSVAPTAQAELGGRVYSGDVDYNGQLMDGTPHRATTGYLGVAAEGGGRWQLQGTLGEGLSAVLHGGVDWWERNLKGASGYRERYRFAYLRFGLEDEAGPGGGWSARGGFLVPLAVREEVNLAGGFELEPKGRPSLYAEFGRRMGTASEAGVAFRRYRFDASDTVAVDIDGDGIRERVFQPASDVDIYSIYATFRF